MATFEEIPWKTPRPQSDAVINERSAWSNKAFVKLLREQGHDAKVLNVLTDELGGPHDLVIANAVFLHFKSAELKAVLKKIYASLQPGGTLAFTVKKGTGSGWSAEKMNGPRFFCYWQAQPLRKVVADTGFTNIELAEAKTTNANWLQIIARKSL